MYSHASYGTHGCLYGLGTKRIGRALRTDDVAYAISPQLLEIADLIKQVLENTPSELTRDICENGICLLGGVSKLSGIDKFIEKNVGIDTYISNNPLECTAIGALECFDRSDSK